MMFENAYYIENKHISIYLKILIVLSIFLFVFITFFEYPKTLYYEGLVIEDNDEYYIEILTRSTSEFTNKYMKVNINDISYSYSINYIEPVNINTNLYYLIRLDVDKVLLLNEQVKLTLSLGKTTILKNIIKNIEKGITYGQTR